MEGHSGSWKVMEGHSIGQGRSCKVKEGQRRSRKVKEGQRSSRKVKEGQGKSWMVFSHHWIDITGEKSYGWWWWPVGI